SSGLDETFGKGDADRANAAAAGRLAGEPFTRALVNGLRLRSNQSNVVVVPGDYDHGELVMDALGIKHGMTTADDLAAVPIPPEEVSRWWLEDSSIPFVVENKTEVEVLAQSADLERKHGSKLVAVTFKYGQGRVVHALGHMFQKEGNLRGAYAMQRLLLNFLY